MEKNNVNQKIEELTDEQLKEITGGDGVESCKMKCGGVFAGVALIGVGVDIDGVVQTRTPVNVNQCIADCERQYSNQ